MKHTMTITLLGAAMTLLPALGLAQTRADALGERLSNESVAPRPQGDWLIPTARPAQQSYTSLAVNDHFTSQVGNGCAYRAEVHGTVRMVRTRDDTRDGRVEYHPNLVVDSRVSCADGRTLAASSQRVTNWPLTPQRLALMVERHAMLVTSEGPRSCSYAPRFAMDPDVRITTGDVRITCTVPRNDARGGGPRMGR